MAKKFKWHRIASHAEAFDFRENNIATIQCDGKTICIGKHGERLYAFAHKCPHASGIMSNGFIDPLGNIVCPLHRYKFSMETGRNTSGEGYFLKTYPIELREDGIYAGIEESSPFSFW